MPAPQFNLFARLAKYDEETGIFEAVAADESIDKSAERFHYETSKPHFLKWSGDIAKATDGKSVGNVRAMHGKSAAGKLTDMTFDDDAKQIKVRGQIIDPVDKAKMAAGVYTAVSIGGSYEKKWDDDANKGVKWYTAIPAEISIVDNPCNPNAHFTVVKADGAHEIEFLSGDAAKAAVEQIEKSVSGGEGDSPPLNGTANEPAPTPDTDPDAAEKAAVSALVALLDARTILPTALQKLAEDAIAASAEVRKAERLVHLGTELAKGDALTNGEVDALRKEFLATDFEGDNVAAIEALGKLNAPAPVAPAVEPALHKGVYAVARVAEAVGCIDNLFQDATWEQMYEGDASQIPARLKMVRDELGMILVEMADEEVAELTDADKALIEIDLAKVGARDSKNDATRIQGIHDHSMALGAACASEKATPISTLAKAFGLNETTPEDDLNKHVAELMRKAELWDKAPAAPKGAVRAVSKANDTDPSNADADTSARDNAIKVAAEKAVSGDPQDLMKVIHQYGGRPGMPPPLAR